MNHRSDKTNGNRDVFNPEWFKKATLATEYSTPNFDGFKPNTSASNYWQHGIETTEEPDSAGNTPVNE